MKNRKKIIVFVLVLGLLCSIFINIAQAVNESSIDPGSDGDPIVSKSYVDSMVQSQIQQIQAMTEKVSQLETKNKLLEDNYNQLVVNYNQTVSELTIIKNQTAAGGLGGYGTVVTESGDKILLGTGTEIILRTGKANSIKGTAGGLLDTRLAKELVTIVPVQLNHLLISSQEDGRGVVSVGKASFLIRGLYKIVKKPVVTPAATPTPKNPSTPSENIRTGTINVTTLNIREKADVNSKIVTKLPKGQVVTILGASGEWIKIKTSQNLIGWTMSKYVQIKK